MRSRSHHCWPASRSTSSSRSVRRRCKRRWRRRARRSRICALLTGVEAYAVDNNAYPTASGEPIQVGPITLHRATDLATPLRVYCRAASGIDPWGHPYLYWSSGQHYAFICLGSDGKVTQQELIVSTIQTVGREKSRIGLGLVAPSSFECLEEDILAADGQFVRLPMTRVHECGSR